MSSNPSPEEAVAIAAAIERFRAETAPAAAEGKGKTSPWQRAALIEGVNAKASVQNLRGEGGDRWLW
jgi:hypothetical protein